MRKASADSERIPNAHRPRSPLPKPRSRTTRSGGLTATAPAALPGRRRGVSPGQFGWNAARGNTLRHSGMRRPREKMSRLQEQAATAANRHIIERPRLTRLLDETSAQVILLVAPAGYGKTVLARQWMAGKRHAWLRATPRTADFGALGLALLDAAQAVSPDVGRRFRGWLHSRRGSESVALPARLLAQDLADWPADAWLVIDDYHLLPAEVESLIRCLRELRTFRLLLTARESPTWSTSRDLLYGNIYELGAAGLAMSEAEATEVLRGQGEAAQEVIALAQGWPAVIGLASFASASGQDRGGPTMAPALHKFIAEELYSSIESHHQKGLLELSLLSAVTLDRAAALLGGNAREVLEESLRVGFVTEQQSGAYSIHPLLREFLHRKLLVMDEASRTHHLNRGHGAPLGRRVVGGRVRSDS